MTIRHAKKSKNIRGGKGAYDSPIPIDMVLTPPNPLAFCHIPSPIFYSEFGRYGELEKRSIRRYKQGWGLRFGILTKTF